ncbi:unnamed protein product [Colias eurytheme]|nr:unnamed protein product [Colias eurytheme]
MAVVGKIKTAMCCICYYFGFKISPPHMLRKYLQLYFPVRGHSFLPADRLFGRIEKDVRKIPVITTRQEYFEIFSKHSRVFELDKDWNLYDVKSLENHYKKVTDWENLSALEWYREILSGSRNREENEEIGDDEACICTEMDTEEIRI